MNKKRFNKKGLQILFATDFILAALLIVGSLLLILFITNSNLSKSEDTLTVSRDASNNLQQLRTFVQTPLQIDETTKPVYEWLNMYFALEFSTTIKDTQLQNKIKSSLQQAAKVFLSRDAGQTLIASVFKDGVVYKEIVPLDLTHYNYGDTRTSDSSGFFGTYHLQIPAYFNQLAETPQTYEIVVSIGYAKIGFSEGVRLQSLFTDQAYAKQGALS
ncbi:MAG: hypothetical protein ACLFNM_00165 [Candidatus Woesearchaeota archaeon]